MFMVVMPVGVYTLHASMGLYTITNEMVEISSESVFVGKEGSGVYCPSP